MGDVFGLSEYLDIEGFEHFGSIRAKTVVICLAIPDPEQSLHLYERQRLI